MMNKTSILALAILLSAHMYFCDNSRPIITQTVYGFLDFTTTIGNTVMVFSPQSTPLLGNFKDYTQVIETKPLKNESLTRETKIQPTKPTFTAKAQSFENTFLTGIQKQNNVEKNSKIKVHSQSEAFQSVSPIQNNLFKPSYDLLSRQPIEYAEEAFRVVNLKPSSNVQGKNSRTSALNKKVNTASSQKHLVGLVTNIDETIAKNGVTTIHRTSVIGTYLSGKYAQVLQSSAQVIKNEKMKTPLNSSLRVLKTAAPFTSKTSSTHNENWKRISGLSRLKIKSSDIVNSDFDKETRNQHSNQSEYSPSRRTRQRVKSKNRRNKCSRSCISQRSSLVQSLPTEINGRKSFRPKILSSSVDMEISTSSFMLKLNRTPGRWQYKTSPKPRVIFRKPLSDQQAVSSLSNIINPTTNSIAEQYYNETLSQNSVLEREDLEYSGSNALLGNSEENEKNRKYLLETINVEISTPADFRDVYYEIITVKSPYTFQAGAAKKTRLITVTSTIEKTLEPESTGASTFKGPLTENILTSSIEVDELLLESDITTFAPIYMNHDLETHQLETVTETFSSAQIKLKTQVFPIINSNHTNFVTLINSYDITSLITATKTLFPLQSNQFIPSKSLSNFNSNLDEAGSEFNLELDFSENKNSEVDSKKPLITYSDANNPDFELLNNKKGTESDILHSKKSSITHLTNVSENSNFSPEQLQQLALLNLFNPTFQTSTSVTNSHLVKRLETIYESFVVPVVNGLITSYRTLSKSIGTVVKTEYQFESTPIATPTLAVSINPFLMQLQPKFHKITSSVVHETIVTHTNSKILKLTFGAKTTYTTLFSTNVVPTLLTSFITTSLPIQETLPFPGYFQHPYPPFPFVG